MRSVVICGSRRFRADVLKFTKTLEKLGVVVYAPYHHSGDDEWETFSKEY